jgi:hypothetical protein
MARQVSEATIERGHQLMLDKKPRTYLSVAAALSVSETTASAVMRILHDRELLYVSRYARAKGNKRWSAVFRLGNRKDATVPPKGRRHAFRERERQWLEVSRAPVKPFRHPQDVAFFGECNPPAA